MSWPERCQQVKGGESAPLLSTGVLGPGPGDMDLLQRVQRRVTEVIKGLQERRRELGLLIQEKRELREGLDQCPEIPEGRLQRARLFFSPSSACLEGLWQFPQTPEAVGAGLWDHQHGYCKPKSCSTHPRCRKLLGQSTSAVTASANSLPSPTQELSKT